MKVNREDKCVGNELRRKQTNGRGLLAKLIGKLVDRNLGKLNGKSCELLRWNRLEFNCFECNYVAWKGNERELSHRTCGGRASFLVWLTLCKTFRC
ncbi:MAG: hypothetical protein ACTS4U_01715 [Candidatus Hodgkinia cicadicola]